MTPAQVHEDQMRILRSIEEKKETRREKLREAELDESEKKEKREEKERKRETKEKEMRANEKKESSGQKESGEKRMSLYVKEREEYEDVFLNELPPGLPPVRGIEHQIDICLRRMGVIASVTPYPSVRHDMIP
ncbi:hypothetical protein P3X46_022171 [Hevea brasiliensis]|uniref:Uncharacterized protein n=1 Tax=Hevea brasiliensis TaxID=3981 RepID=A0ABQ9LJS1_HEVBR|nr:hypothetical protein P3X46_022171 [Hevea brasiliensis]